MSGENWRCDSIVQKGVIREDKMDDDAKNVGTFDLLAMRYMPDEDDPTVADFEFFGIKESVLG